MLLDAGIEAFPIPPAMIYTVIAALSAAIVWMFLFIIKSTKAHNKQNVDLIEKVTTVVINNNQNTKENTKAIDELTNQIRQTTKIRK